MNSLRQSLPNMFHLIFAYVVIIFHIITILILTTFNITSFSLFQESDCDSIVSSPEPAYTVGIDSGSNGARIYSNRTKEEETHNESQIPQHTTQMNGAMGGLVSLQNISSIQQNLPQMASLATGLQSMASLAANPAANAPLNLSVSASAITPRTSQSSTAKLDHTTNMSSNSLTSHPAATNGLQSTPNHLLGAQQPALMPQLILASGQLVPGIQGAQLLIPTSQGLVTQTILTIPVNHVNSSDQIVNLALNNGQVVSTSLANLQAMAHTNLLNNTAASNTVTNGNIGPGLLGSAGLSHLLNNGSSPNLLQNIPKLLTSHSPTQSLLNPLNQSSMMTSQPQMNLHNSPSPQSTPPQSHRNHMGSSNHYSESKLHQQQTLPPSCTPPNITPSMIPSINGELTITPSHSINSSQNFKRSPPRSESPSCHENSSNDLMIDSPNQPTINQTNSNVIDGINLDEIKDFAKAFKLRRLSLGLTQTQVGQALSVTEGPAYSQSAICRFEKLDITPKSAQKIKPVLERWMKEAEDRYKSGQNHLTDFIGIEPSKKRKRRTSFTPQALELLNAHFERNTHPSGTEITGLAHQLGYEREVIRIWFCNKRQALKNTVRMMSKGMV
ncbi:hypothetical protein HHI36_007675 [Cryptolaemus montrouzieri]|uniref:POU domain protein n=1 Tax=Cryptolaemus montrouzieri TaxID=559131 RepID=A0ABD2MQS9_9CUCU